MSEKCPKNKLGTLLLGGARPKRMALFFGLLVLATLSVASGAPAAGQGTERGDREKPNIVFILADDMRADDLEHMPQTRQLLAEQGLTFSNAFVTYSLCCPSRASILRGQYAHNHRVLEGDAPLGGFEKFQMEGHENSTVATWLQDSGYQTMFLGKYLNGYGKNGSETYVPPGWGEWFAKLDKGYYDYQLNENGELVSYGRAKQDYYTDVLADKAKAYVSRAANDSKPFFMYLAPATPHNPFTPAPRHKDEYAGVNAPQPPSFNEGDIEDKPEWVQSSSELDSDDKKEIDKAYRDRLRMLLSLDEMVMGLIRELKTMGELDNTYVFFASDNGYHLGEHRLSLTKRTPYEEANRIPLVVRGPGVPAGRTVDEMALNIDFAPTFAELAGASAPSFVDGRSLAPLLGGTPPATWRSAFLLENWREQIPHRPGVAPTYDGIRTETQKYVEYATGEKELYDLNNDPYELESLHETADPALVESLESRLEALKACAGESCRQAEDRP